jgi:hypothetical protein
LCSRGCEKSVRYAVGAESGDALSQANHFDAIIALDAADGRRLSIFASDLSFVLNPIDQPSRLLSAD